MRSLRTCWRSSCSSREDQMSDHEYTKLNDRESESHGQGPARDRNKVNPFVWFAQSDFGQGLLPPPKLLRPGNWNEDSYEKVRTIAAQ